MSYRTVIVAVPRKQAPWFKKRRVFPIEVQVNQKTAVYAGSTFELRPVADGFTAVFRPGSNLPLGEYSIHGVRHTISENAAKDVRVIRAAVLDAEYDVPLALELVDGSLVHPGPCYHQRGLFVVKKHVYLEDDEERCCVCDEAFE